MIITERMNKKLIYLISSLLVTSCSLAPGIGDTSQIFLKNDEVILPDQDLSIKIINVDQKVIESMDKDFSYKVQPGDVLTFIIWGLEDIFPPVQFGASAINPQNSRTVDTDGSIFFPYVGKIQVAGLSIDQVRKKVYELLSNDFVDPQLDVTVAKYNENRRAYLLGEVIQPQSFFVGIEKVSLTDAIGLAKGLDPRFSNAQNIYLIRTYENTPVIYKVNLKTPERFLITNDIYIRPRDIIYISPSGITKWNRFFSQIFPFASFFNQVNNIND